MSKEQKKSVVNHTIILMALTAMALVAVVMIFLLSKKPSGNYSSENTNQTSFCTQPQTTTRGDPSVETTAQLETQPHTYPTVEVVERLEGSYEQWLAAAAIVGISMEYPDFAPVGIYAATETPVADRLLSGGVYVHFFSEGEERLLVCKPLAQERADVLGTLDLYSKELGYNSFDLIALDSVDLSAMISLSFGELRSYMEQSMLVSVIGR